MLIKNKNGTFTLHIKTDFAINASSELSIPIDADCIYAVS